ncbi:DUF2155 domain-containing protein [Roseiterribacter gracilis]|uniref:DUF2155 domain-containing protein n=1 Tax=Roseiterribacter gracilis TaxID=2812848 RepID=A0A8S8XF17_9PROT|nr:hypothetical protein TMPK1_28290 [Rhodospirillales bacterium TMPK1]
MKVFALTALLASLASAAALAQDAPRPAAQPRAAAPRPEKPADAELPPALPPGSMIDHPIAELQALDKITARVRPIEARVGQTFTFGTLNLQVEACRKAPPEEPRESAAFLRIWEAKPGQASKWVFSGWMFASSPALSAMDHPVYDIWLKDCGGPAAGATARDDAAPAQPQAAPEQPKPKR